MPDTDLPSEIAALRPYLLKVARLQLRNAAWAEDAVSETTLAALEHADRFDRRSQLKTWVVSILRHKVIDQLRRGLREVQAPDDADSDADDPIEGLLFDARGRFHAPPSPWPEPEGALAERQFLGIVEACVERLPGRLGRVFLMREWLELDSAEICKDLGLSASNLWVMLHRARLRLRECIELQWTR